VLVSVFVDLKNVLEISAGVYIDEKYNVHSYDLSKVVLVTASNFGFINHLANFKCFIDRLHMKALVLTLDERTHSVVVSKMMSTFQTYYLTAKLSEPIVNEDSNKFRSFQFNLISSRKMEAVYEAMNIGYDVIFIDNDVILLQDPVPYFISSGVDYVHSLNQFCSK
jgi:hypothetical protein